MKYFFRLHEVKAEPMSHKDYCEYRGWDYKEQKNHDGYYVIDKYGSESWVAKERFETMFTEFTDNSFFEATLRPTMDVQDAKEVEQTETEQMETKIIYSLSKMVTPKDDALDDAIVIHKTRATRIQLDGRDFYRIELSGGQEGGVVPISMTTSEDVFCIVSYKGRAVVWGHTLEGLIKYAKTHWDM